MLAFCMLCVLQRLKDTMIGTGLNTTACSEVFWNSTCAVFAHQCLTAHCREECEGYISSVWDWLEGLGTGISRADSSTWRAPHWPPAFKGIINSLEVSHQAFVWRVRSNMRLIKVSLSTVPVFLMLQPDIHVALLKAWQVPPCLKSSNDCLKTFAHSGPCHIGNPLL